MVKKKIAKVKRKPLILPTKKTVIAQSFIDHITLFFGPPGVGKTTFVNELDDKVFFISTDRGTRSQPTLREECSSVEKLNRIIKALVKQKSKYNMVCVDHVDDIAYMFEEEVCEKLDIDSLADAKWGKGWKLYRKMIFGFIQKIKSLDLGIVFIAHETLKPVKQGGIEMDRSMPELSKGAWKCIIPLCDLVGYCTFKPIKIQGKRKEQRILVTQPQRDIYAKDRTKREKPKKGFELLNGKKFVSTFN